MRDLVVQTVVLAGVPLAFWRPFAGLLFYTWLAYMRPQDLAWSLKGDRFSFYVAAAMLLGLLVTIGRERLVTLKLQSVLLFLLLVWVTVTVQTAVVPALSKVTYDRFWKVVLVSLLTTGLVRSYERFRPLLLVTAFSLGLLGLKYGIHGLIRGGARFDHGPGGLMRDNNDFALALNMALPLLVGIVMTEKSRPLRLGAAVMAAFSMLTIFFTFSRGGLLTLGVVGVLLLLLAKRRLLAGAVLALGLAGFFYFSTEGFRQDYTARTETITAYEEDGSAMGRINAWKTAWRIFLDFPVVGVGPDNMVAVFHSYSPRTDRARVAHSTYFQLLAECGLPGLLLFLSLLAVTLWRLQLLAARAAPAAPWAPVYARMLQVSIAGFIVGGAFLNRAFFDFTYHLVALSVALELAAEAAATAPVSAAGAAAAALSAPELPWWRRPAPTGGGY